MSQAAASSQVSHATHRLSPVSVSPGGACSEEASTAAALHFIALMGSSTRLVSSRSGQGRAGLVNWPWPDAVAVSIKVSFRWLVKFSRSRSLIAACHSPRFCFINKDIKSAVMFGHVSSDLLVDSSSVAVWQRGGLTLFNFTCLPPQSILKTLPWPRHYSRQQTENLNPSSDIVNRLVMSLRNAFGCAVCADQVINHH